LKKIRFLFVFAVNYSSLKENGIHKIKKIKKLKSETAKKIYVGASLLKYIAHRNR